MTEKPTDWIRNVSDNIFAQFICNGEQSDAQYFRIRESISSMIKESLPQESTYEGGYQKARIYNFDGMNYLIPESKDFEFRKYMIEAEEQGPNRDDTAFIEKWYDYSYEIEDMEVYVLSPTPTEGTH